MRNRLAVPRAAIDRLAIGGIGRGHLELVLVDVSGMGMVEVAVVEIVDVVLVPDPGMPA
ncbi:hypothetical protein D3C72_2053050 [compost metagenome]